MTYQVHHYFVFRLILPSTTWCVVRMRLINKQNKWGYCSKSLQTWSQSSPQHKVRNDSLSIRGGMLFSDIVISRNFQVTSWRLAASAYLSSSNNLMPLLSMVIHISVDNISTNVFQSSRVVVAIAYQSATMKSS